MNKLTKRILYKLGVSYCEKCGVRIDIERGSRLCFKCGRASSNRTIPTSHDINKDWKEWMES